jgi:hypothetical protein
VAREQQVTESRLVNDILRNVFSLPAWICQLESGHKIAMIAA